MSSVVKGSCVFPVLIFYQVIDGIDTFFSFVSASCLASIRPSPGGLANKMVNGRAEF